VPERSGAANFHGVSYKILAEVEITDQGAQGVIFAQGSRFGGHALFVKDRKLHYVYNFLGLKSEQHLGSAPLEPGAYVLGVDTPLFPFEGGTIVKVEVSIGDDAYVDLERQLLAALARN